MDDVIHTSMMSLLAHSRSAAVMKRQRNDIRSFLAKKTSVSNDGRYFAISFTILMIDFLCVHCLVSENPSLCEESFSSQNSPAVQHHPPTSSNLPSTSCLLEPPQAQPFFVQIQFRIPHHAFHRVHPVSMQTLTSLSVTDDSLTEDSCNDIGIVLDRVLNLTNAEKYSLLYHHMPPP